MKAWKYRHLLWQFIAALDSGKYDKLDIEEVRRRANAGTISAFLVDRFSADCDFSTFEPSDWAAISESWASIANAVDARRKFGVENKGMSLLMAYALQSFLQLQTEENQA